MESLRQLQKSSDMSTDNQRSHSLGKIFPRLIKIVQFRTSQTDSISRAIRFMKEWLILSVPRRCSSGLAAVVIFIVETKDDVNVADKPAYIQHGRIYTPAVYSCARNGKQGTQISAMYGTRQQDLAQNDASGNAPGKRHTQYML